MKFVRLWALCFITASLVYGCSSRPSKLPVLQSSQTAGAIEETTGSVESPVAESEVSDTRVAEMEKSLQEQSEAAQKAMAEKSSLESSVQSLNSEVQAMAAQMESMTSEEQKSDLQKQIASIEQEKAAAEEKMANLNAADAAAQKELAALKAEIEKLKKDLAAAKAGKASTVVNNAAATAAAFYKFYYAGNICLDVQGSSKADNAPILGFNCLAANLNQQFNYDVKGNYFFLRSRVSGKCVASTATTVASPVVQRTCTNTTDKAWQWFGVSGTTGKLRNIYSGKCLGVNSGKILQSECNSVYAINFKFFKI